MSCDLTKGRLLGCRDAVGGLDKVYFIPKGTLGTITYDVDGSTITGVSGTPTAYEYELHLGNNLTENINSSEENGTTFYEQVLSLTLKKLTKEDNAELKNLVKSRAHCMVLDNMGEYRLVGLEKGIVSVGGSAVSGDALGDLNGYTLTLTAKEKELANFYTGVFATEFTVVTGS